MKIVVLAGGISPEREVSLSSGSLIANALIKKGHRVLFLDLYLGMPSLPEDPDCLFTDSLIHEHAISKAIPNMEELKTRAENGNALIGKNVLELCRRADLVFLALHGGIGENGQIQAVLEAYGIPHTGSSYEGALLAMNKDLSKRLWRDAGVPTPDWVLLDRKDPEKDLAEAIARLGKDVVVKPIGCGSSVGVSIPKDEAALSRAVKEAAEWGQLLLERRIFGREFAIGILGDEILPPVEIIPKRGFYDYKNKYQGTTEEICPAEMPEGVLEKAKDFSKKAFDALHLSGYARFDLLLDRENRLWFLEANTLPGMTPNSLLPRAAVAAGISYPDLCQRIAELAKPSCQ